MQRIDYPKASPKAFKALYGLQQFVSQCGLDEGLLHMVYLRASQVNGCAFCIDMHWKDAVALGEDPQRLYMLDAWREWPEGYSDRERAALEWTETVTRVGETHAPDEVYERVRREFGEGELVDLTVAVATINAWNRLSIAMRTAAGGYKAPAR